MSRTHSVKVTALQSNVFSFSHRQYLSLESSFEGKDYVCDRLLQFLLNEASSGITDKLSFQLMEALLYRVHLNLLTGRMESALAILQVKDILELISVGGSNRTN